MELRGDIMLNKTEGELKFLEVVKYLIHDFDECIWMYDLSNNSFTYISDAVEDLLGYTHEEVKTLTLETMFTSESLISFYKIVQANVENYIQNGKDEVIHFKSKQYTKKNYEIFLDTSAKLIVDDETNQIYLAGVFRIEEEQHNQQDEKIVDNLKQIINNLENQIETLSEIVITDGLTGIYNRVFFDQKVNEYMGVYHNEDLSMLLIDIDDFKLVNDRFGHDIGDQVLKEVTILTKEVLNEQFVFARWGGEEFAVLLNNVKEQQAIDIAEYIRKNIESRKMNHVGKITVSIGATTITSNDSYKDFFRRADAALYKAKRQGKNQVVFLDESVRSPYARIDLKFKKEWLSGNESIDSEHKELLDLSVQLIEASTVNLYSEEVKDLINRIISHVISHFKHEEEILAQYNYPKVEEHKHIHEKLINDTKKLLVKFDTKELKTSHFISYLLDDLLMGHLLKEDVKFFKYFKK